MNTRPDMYHISFAQDRLFVKCVVYGVFVLEFAQTIVIAHDAFLAFARGFGRIEELNSVHTEWFATPMVSGVGVFILVAGSPLFH